MRKVLVLVEGQTEEELVKNVLAPAALSRDVHLVPSVVITSASSAATHRGGGSWSHYEKRLRQFLATSYLSKVGLLLDYYAYPKDAPGQARCWWLRPACRPCWSAVPRSAPGGRTCWPEGGLNGRRTAGLPCSCTGSPHTTCARSHLGIARLGVSHLAAPALGVRLQVLLHALDLGG